MDNVNPYSTEIRYTLDMMGYMLEKHQPRSVRLYTDSIEIAKAIVRRTASGARELFVGTEEVCEAVRASLGISVAVADERTADVALCPMSLDETVLPRERVLVAAVRNALSYKSLLYPKAAHTTALGTLARVRRQFKIKEVVGMYAPHYVALLALAYLVGRWSASAYFRLSDLAMQYLYEFGPLWRLSYIVIFAGHR